MFAQTKTQRIGEIKYISQQSIYINVGRNQGVSVGDTVRVLRNHRLIGRLVVENVASHSSACKRVSGKRPFKQGDGIEIFVRVSSKPAPDVSAPAVAKTPPATSKPSYQKKYRKRRRVVKNNQISGRIGVQSIWLNDQSGSNLGYKQFGMRSKIKVKRFLSLPLEFQMRWRSRNHQRDRFVAGVVDESNWTHRVQEFSLQYHAKNSPYEVGFGRLLSREVRGLGYVDGVAISMNLYGPWKVGVVGGTEPGLENSAFQTNEQKFGAFVTVERGDYQSKRLESTFAFSGNYHSAKVSREFFYFQNAFNMGSRFSVYQTVEFDVNRGWKGRTSSVFELTNFFLSTTYSPTSSLTLNASYDSRKAVRIYETRSIPDSLFDESTRQGLHAGLTLRLSRTIRFSSSVGVRFRRGDLDNTYSASTSLSVRQIFNTWATANLRFSFFSTMFSKGYRPQLMVRLPVTRKLSTNISAGSYILQNGPTTTRNNWWEATAYYRISRWLYTNVGYHAFLSDQLQSGRIFVESGVVF